MNKPQRRRGFLASPNGAMNLQINMSQKGYTQEKLAEEADVSVEQVRNLCHPNWQRKTQKDAILKIARVLELKPTDIVDPNEWYPPSSSENTQSQLKPSREYLSHLPKQNLPAQYNEFIGRKKEICDLMRYLSDDHAASIITVDGIGGVGKTALVLEAAYLCLEYREYRHKKIDPITPFLKINCEIPFFDLIIFTSAKETRLLPDRIISNLTAQRTLQEIYRIIAYTLQEPYLLQGNDQEQLERIRQRLRPERTLLIVDNLETIEDKNKVVSFLYELPRGVKSIITTREQAGFAPIHLDSLSQKESKQLIQQQANDKGITNLTGQQKNSLYKASGGVPIVIIYTIGRLTMSSSLETVLEDLKDANGDVAFFCFKKSVDDLKNQPAYRLLMAIAIFYKAPDREAVVEVAGLSTEPMLSMNKELEKLQQFSLVRLHRGRYLMLPLTREYALAELAKNPNFKKEALNRWVEWYKKFAQKHHDSAKKPERFIIGYSRFHEEWDNLLAVLRWCKDEERYEDVKELWSYLNNYANLRGHWKDRLFWLGWLIKQSTLRGDHKTTLKAKSRKARILLIMGTSNDLEKSQKLLLEAWNLREYADFHDLDYLTNHLAGLYLRLEQYEEAHKWLDIEQELLDQENLSPEDRINYQIYIDRERSEVSFHEKQYSQAKELCYKVIEQAELIRNQRNKNYAQKILADIAIAEGRFEKAENLLKVGFDEVKLNRDKRRMTYYMASFAGLEKAKGNFDTAREWANKAHNYFCDLGMMRDAKELESLLDSLR
jgi:transcriptional regulator with XRE-family HTH domain